MHYYPDNEVNLRMDDDFEKQGPSLLFAVVVAVPCCVIAIILITLVVAIKKIRKEKKNSQNIELEEHGGPHGPSGRRGGNISVYTEES